MVHDIFDHIRLSRHYWQSVPFVEMAELYLSRFLRTVSQSMIGLFVAVFLYQKGYSISQIMLLIGAYFILRVGFSFGCAYYVAWAGPKRATFISNILIVPSLLALTTIEQYTFTSVVVYFVFQALSLTLYYIASDVQFSSLKHDQKEGKEIGWLHIMEKIATGVAPAIGGFVAYLFGPESAMWVAAVLSVASAVPLFLSPEKIRRKQKIIFRGLPVKRIGSQLFSHGVAGADYMVSSVTWALFIAVIVFGTGDDSVYAKLGLAFSITLITSIICSRLYGVLIDRRRGRELYRTGVGVNVVVHAIRPFITTPVGVAVTNAINEVGTSAYQMPYVRSLFDEADNLAGYRTVYVAVMSAAYCLGGAVVSFITAILVMWLGVSGGLEASFVVMAVVALLMFRSGFAALRS